MKFNFEIENVCVFSPFLPFIECIEKKMDTVEPKRRTARKKPSTVTFPEEITCQYSRFTHLLSHAASRKWLLYEWQYNEIDDAFFHKCRTFEMFLNAKFPHLKTRNLTQTEWRVVRKLILQRKCRRFSSKFIHEQRIELEKYRCSYRILEENNRHDQLDKLNGFHGAVGDFISTLDSPKSQSDQLFRLYVEVKKLFATKSGLVMKLREINNSRAEMQQQQHHQQQQQHSMVNGNSNIESAAMTGATAIKVVSKLRECNKEIMFKLNRMMCFRVVKDALLVNANKRKQIALAFSPAYFGRISSAQVYETQQLYQSQRFISSTNVHTLFETMLKQFLVALQYDVMLKINEMVDEFADDLIKQHMPVINTILPSNYVGYFENVCLPKFFEVLSLLNELLI